MVQLTSDDLADAGELVAAVGRELSGIVTSRGSGDTFVSYGPDGSRLPEQRFTFLTVVTGDRYDAASDLTGTSAHTG